MGLDSLPPWLSVSPQHFLEAAQGGFNTGLKIAETQNQAQQARERAALAAQENALRAWEEQQRMQYRVQELESERERRDLERQALADYRQGMLGIDKDRLARETLRDEEIGRHNLAMEKAAMDRLTGQGMELGEPVKQELFPGVFMVHAPGSQRWQLYDSTKGSEKTKDLTPGQAANLLAKLPQIDMLRMSAPTNSLTTKYSGDLENLIFGGLRGNPASGTNPMSAPSQVNEVIRYTKDGRKAVFDAATKKFLRYAD